MSEPDYTKITEDVRYQVDRLTDVFKLNLLLMGGLTTILAIIFNSVDEVSSASSIGVALFFGLGVLFWLFSLLTSVGSQLIARPSYTTQYDSEKISTKQISDKWRKIVHQGATPQQLHCFVILALIYFSVSLFFFFLSFIEFSVSFMELEIWSLEYTLRLGAGIVTMLFIVTAILLIYPIIIWNFIVSLADRGQIVLRSLFSINPLTLHHDVSWMCPMDYHIMDAIYQEGNSTTVKKIQTLKGSHECYLKNRCGVLCENGLLKETEKGTEYALTEKGQQLFDRKLYPFTMGRENSS